MNCHKRVMLFLMALLLVPAFIFAGGQQDEPAAAADNGEIPRERTVIFDIGSGRVADPENFNPYIPGSIKDQGLRNAMIEPLFVLNYESGELMPWQAESYTQNDDGSEWTITLRDGIKWSDGVDMTADDVVFTINLLIDTPSMWNAGDMTAWVESCTKVDELTTKFVLTGPNPRFVLDYFAVKIGDRHHILPKHIWEGQDPSTFTNYDPAKGWPVFTGAYLLDSVSETEFTYVRDEDWWGYESGWKDLPKPEKLIWATFGTEETKVAAMSNDEIDSLMDISLGAFYALQGRNPNVIAWYDDLPFSWPDPCARNIEFNTTVAPWDNANMRLAVNYAIDRDEVVTIAYEGATKPSTTFYPAYSGLDKYIEMVDGVPGFNPAKAKSLIEGEGYAMNTRSGYYEKDGEELKFHIQTPEPLIENQKIAQVVVEQLQRIGINASYGNVAYGTFWDNFFNGNFEGRSGWQTCGSVNEPWASLNTMNAKWAKPVGERATSNAWRWENAEFSALVEQIGVLPLGDPRIDSLYVQAMDIFFAEMPVIPVTQAKKIVPFNTTYWTNWPTADNNYIHPPTWWQSTHVILHELEPVK